MFYVFCFTILKENYGLYYKENPPWNWIQRSLKIYFTIMFTIQEHIKTVKIHMVKFKVTILDRPKIMEVL